MQLPENIGRLVTIIKRGAADPAHGALLWVGTGLSIPAGYPSWTQLIERLRGASVEPLQDMPDSLQAIDAFVRVNGKGLLDQQLQEIFDYKQPLPYHRDLMHLPWKGIITTNYDELLEDALKQIEKSYLLITLEQNLDLATGNRLPLLKVHGGITNFREVVLSGKSYTTFHDRHPLLKADLESSLRKYSLVFFGYSMTDPRLLNWLRAMSTADREMLLPSCAVLTEDGWNRLPKPDRDLLEEGNIRPILVQDHGDIPELISYLLREIPSPSLPTQGVQFDITFTSEQHDQWRTVSNGEEHVVDVPWKDFNAFGIALMEFVALTRNAVSDDQIGTLHTRAAQLGDTLGQALMSADTWQSLRQAAAQSGPQPVTIASDEPLILSLPWELLRMDGTYVVREGTFDLLRTTASSALQPATLTPPDRFLKLVVNVSAPESSTQLNYEDESYRLVRALHDHSEVIFTELGTIDDLIGTVVDQSPTGVHFSGHGEPGALVFEDDAGQSETIAIEDMIQRIRQADGTLPRLFYLASCHGNTAPNLDTNRPGTTISAAHLHREGVVQVLGYYGPIVDTLSTLAEAVFYRSLAEGRSTRSAVRRARLALVHGPEVDGDSHHRAEAVTAQVSRHPFAWAQLVFYHRGPDHPLSLKLPERYAQTLEAGLQRSYTGTDQRQILSTGFIGRRQELHQFRRAMRRGQHVFVFQGLGGLGKSTLAFKALPILTRDGHDPSLTIWCQELELADNPAHELTDKLSEAAHVLFGKQWVDVVQTVDRMPEATEPQRFGFFLETILQFVPQLVLYLDNLESLLRGPDDEDPKAFGKWRSKDLQAIWSILKQLSGNKLSVVASCRYRHPSFEADTLHVPEMNDAAIFRMMGWFEGLRRLSLTNRAHLVDRLHGHPRAVEFLNDLIRDALIKWEIRHGDWVTPRTPKDTQDEWQGLIASALPDVDAQLRTNLLFDTIWHQVLDDRCRRMLFRMTLLKRPWDWNLMMRLDDADDTEKQTETTAEKLRTTSLVGEVQEWREDRWMRLFQIHPTTARFITERTDAAEVDILKQATYLRVGTYLEEMGKTSPDIHNNLDAGHYLFAGGEFNRAHDILSPASSLLQEYGMVRTGLTILKPFEAVAKQLSPDRKGTLLGTLGSSYFRLGQFKPAIEYHEQSLAISQETGNQWNIGIVLGNLGLAYRALGQVQEAIEYHEQSLTISREIGNQQGEVSQLNGLGNVYYTLGEVQKAIEYHEQSLAISREIGDRWNIGTALGNLGLAYSTLGEVQKAIGYWEDALAIHRDVGDRWGEGNQLGNLGLTYNTLGEFQKAIGYLEKALAIQRDIGDRRGEGNQLGNLGNVYLSLDEFQKAIEYYEQALAIQKDIGDRRGEGNQLGNLRNVYLSLDEVQKAIEYYEQSLTISREIGNQQGEGIRLANLGRAYRTLRNMEKMKALWQEALTKFLPGTPQYKQLEVWLQATE